MLAEARIGAAAESRGLRLLLRFYAALFALGALVFLVAPGRVIEVLNRVGDQLGFAPTATTPTFWAALAVAYMVVISALAWLAQGRPARADLVLLLILAKVSSSLVALAYFVLAVHAFAFLANFVVDGAIAASIYVLYGVKVPTLPSPHGGEDN